MPKSPKSYYASPVVLGKNGLECKTTNKIVYNRRCYNLDIFPNSSILVNNCPFDMRVPAYTNWNTAFGSQKPLISLRLEHNNQKTNVAVRTASQTKANPINLIHMQLQTHNR